MKIKATVYPNKESNTNLKAMVILVVEDCLVINSVKIVEGKKGLFVSMPQYRDKKGDYKDIVYPISKEKRNSLTALILAEYEKMAGTEDSTTSI
jgi:stage V sporulation protein G